MTTKEKVLAVIGFVVMIACVAIGGMIDQIFLAEGYIH